MPEAIEKVVDCLPSNQRHGTDKFLSWLNDHIAGSSVMLHRAEDELI
jgi:hypothetical protein